MGQGVDGVALIGKRRRCRMVAGRYIGWCIVLYSEYWTCC